MADKELLEAQDGAGEEQEKPKADTRNAKERFYDKLPFTYRQVDIFVKPMVVLVAAVLVWAIVNGAN